MFLVFLPGYWLLIKNGGLDSKDCLPMQKIQVQSLSWEHPLGKQMATHSSILAWRNPGKDRGAWQATIHGVAKSQTWLND